METQGSLIIIYIKKYFTQYLNTICYIIYIDIFKVLYKHVYSSIIMMYL